MPLDTSIYANLLRPPKSVAEYDAEAVQGQTNRLALQSGQAQLQDRQRAIDDGNKLRQLVSGFGQDQGANYNMLLGAGQLDAAQKYVKSNADVAKVQADAKESTAKTAKSEQDVGVRSFDSIAQTMGALRNVPGGATKQHVANAVQHLVDVGILRPDMAGKVVQAAPDNPAEMPQWLATQQAAALTAKEQLPTMSTRNLGGTTDTLSMNPITQEVKVINSAKNSQTPDNAASNARMAADAQASRAQADRHFNATQESGKSQIVQSDDGPLLVNTKSGTGKQIIGPDGKPLAGVSKPLNDSQSKALLFGTRMQEAHKILGTLAGEGTTTSVPGSRAPGIGGIISALSPEKQQMLDQAKRDFMTADLRRESGASISPGEFDTADKQYFPQPGDGAKVIAQKARNRELAFKGILAEVPEKQRGAITPAAAPAASGPAKVSNASDYAKLPSGTEYVDPNGHTRRKP